jgi:deoxyxylulose-5-phosphate synthase
MSSRNGKAIKVILNDNGYYVPSKNVKKINKFLTNLNSTVMATAAKKSAKKGATKKAAKPAAKKEKVEKAITRANFPDKGWGYDKSEHDQIAKFGISHGLRNLSQVIRFAMNKAGVVTSKNFDK